MIASGGGMVWRLDNGTQEEQHHPYEEAGRPEGRDPEMVPVQQKIREGDDILLGGHKTGSAAPEVSKFDDEQIEPFALEGFRPYDVEGAARAGLSEW